MNANSTNINIDLYNSLYPQYSWPKTYKEYIQKKRKHDTEHHSKTISKKLANDPHYIQSDQFWSKDFATLCYNTQFIPRRKPKIYKKYIKESDLKFYNDFIEHASSEDRGIFSLKPQPQPKQKKENLEDNHLILHQIKEIRIFPDNIPKNNPSDIIPRKHTTVSVDNYINDQLFKIVMDNKKQYKTREDLHSLISCNKHFKKQYQISDSKEMNMLNAAQFYMNNYSPKSYSHRKRKTFILNSHGLAFDTPYKTFLAARKFFRLLIKLFPSGDMVVPAFFGLAQCEAMQQAYIESYKNCELAVHTALQRTDSYYLEKNVKETSEKLFKYVKKYKNKASLKLETKYKLTEKIKDEKHPYQDSCFYKDLKFDPTKAKNNFAKAQISFDKETKQIQLKIVCFKKF